MAHCTISTRSRTHTRQQLPHKAPRTRRMDLPEVAHNHTQEAPRVAAALLDSLLLLLLLLGLSAPVHAAAWYVARCRVLAVLQPNRQAPLLPTGLPRCVHAPSLNLRQQWQQ
jgi:hypothetical protein